MRRTSHTEAQALVEFALAATLIFFLLAAAIDLGFLFFTKQALTAAAQEGATYGSRWLLHDGMVSRLDIPEIQKRVRFESGSSGGNGIIRLTDLNSDGIDDSGQSSVIDPTGKTGYIQVTALADVNLDGDPTNDNTICENPATSTVTCYAYVVVKKNYNFFFPLAPSFDNSFTIPSSFYMIIRDSYHVNDSGPPVFSTPTPQPNQDSIVIQWVNPTSSGAFPTNRSSTTWQVKAFDSNVGTTDGAGITQVVMTVTGNGITIANTDPGPSWCFFSGNCSQMKTTDWNKLTKGTYTLTVTAYSSSGKSKSDSITLTKP